MESIRIYDNDGGGDENSSLVEKDGYYVTAFFAKTSRTAESETTRLGAIIE